MRQRANKWVVLAMVILGIAVQLKSQGWKPIRQLFCSTTKDDAQLANVAAQQIAEWLPLPEERATVTVARVVGDRDGLLSESLEIWVGQRNVNLLRSPWYLDAGYLFGLIKEPTNEKVARMHRGAENADLVVSVVVRNWATFPESNRKLTASVKLADPKTGRIEAETDVVCPVESSGLFSLFSGGESDAPGESIPVVTPPTAESSELDGNSFPVLFKDQPPRQRMSDVINSRFCGRFLIWIIGTLLIPILFHNSLASTLRRKSNSANALLLLLFLSTSAPAGWWLWARELAYPQGLWFMAGAFGGGVLYFGHSLKAISEELIG